MYNLRCYVGLGLLMASLAGCGPSQDEKQAMAVFNNLEALIERGGYVKEFQRFEKGEENVFEIEAEIVDENGVPLGLLRSTRVEGLMTRKPRIHWYTTPGVREEWPQRHRGGRRR